jgi:hypothetical protein
MASDHQGSTKIYFMLNPTHAQHRVNKPYYTIMIRRYPAPAPRSRRKQKGSEAPLSRPYLSPKIAAGSDRHLSCHAKQTRAYYLLLQRARRSATSCDEQQIEICIAVYSLVMASDTASSNSVVGQGVRAEQQAVGGAVHHDHRDHRHQQQTAPQPPAVCTVRTDGARSFGALPPIIHVDKTECHFRERSCWANAARRSSTAVQISGQLRVSTDALAVVANLMQRLQRCRTMYGSFVLIKSCSVKS